MSEEEDAAYRRKVRSNYFQTEFTVSVVKGKDAERASVSAPGIGDDDRKKVSISIQTGSRSMVGAEEIPKERRRWVRPPLVGQASSGSDSQLSIATVHDERNSEDDIVESSQEPFVSTADYPNRKDYISEKPPEGSSAIAPDNRAPSPSSASSLTSGRPLEWDSGADVGYYHGYPGGNGADRLSSLEIMALGGSTSLLTRSDPEGTVSNSSQPTPLPTAPTNAKNPNKTIGQAATLSFIGEPDAESTPNAYSSRSSRASTSTRNRDAAKTSNLFPEIIVIEDELSSESDDANHKSREISIKMDEAPKRSSSMEDMGAANQQQSPFIRSQSQNNINFDMVSHLLKLVQPQSNSSSSVATVVKGGPATNSSDRRESVGSGGNRRTNSFEYLPGAAFEQADNDPLKTDIDRGVRLLADFMKGTSANNTVLKKKLLKKVVEELLEKKYPGEGSSSSGASLQAHRRSSAVWLEGNSALPQPSLTWQGLPSAPEGAEISSKSWPVSSRPIELLDERCVTRRGRSKEPARRDVSGGSESQDSLIARMDKANKPPDSSTLSSSVAESSIKQHKQSLPGHQTNHVAADPRSLGQPWASSSTSPHSDWKAPATQSEMIYERLRTKKGLDTVDPGVLRYLHGERENQLDWIKKEINHLSNLKSLLEMHESLRKNFDDLKRTKTRKEKSHSAGVKPARPTRKLACGARSEPLKPCRLKDESATLSSDTGWDSHDYGSAGRGILKKNASTNTTVLNRDRPMVTLKEPISYTIVFDSKGSQSKKNVRVPLDNVPIRSNHNTNQSGVAIADRETLMKESRERIHEQYNINLQKELVAKKPGYVARAEMRRQTVAELAAMREVREKHRKSILTAAVNGDPAPPIPHPMAVKRVVSQKSMRNLTEKNYRKSALVKQQQQARKKKEETVTNRLMADLFNRNLQRRILKGETHLSNSVNVI